VFWAWLSRWWAGWKDALAIVSPAIVVGWQRQGFRLWRRWESRGRDGRPRIDAEVRRLIRRMARDNPLWGAPQIQAELRLLGHDVAESTVAKYMSRRRGPPSPRWRSFLRNKHRTVLRLFKRSADEVFGTHNRVTGQEQAR
jgi:putative transposase